MALADALLELQELTERLRRDCPWDREQTERTIVPHTVEEAYEVADAALADQPEKLLDELGDLLFQVYFLALLLSERGHGDLEQVARAVHEKLVRRHPHVFGDVEARTPGRVRENWEALKEEEGREGIFHHVPRDLPGAAARPQGAAPRRGDRVRVPRRGGGACRPRERARRGEGRARWADPAPETPPDQRVAEEIGDLLFASVNVARRLNVDPELELRRASDRFVERVERAEQLAGRAGERFADLDLERQDRYFDLAKEEL